MGYRYHNFNKYTFPPTLLPVLQLPPPLPLLPCHYHYHHHYHHDYNQNLNKHFKMSLPKGWTERMSKSRKIPYYVNEYTNKTQWDKPTKPAEPEGETVTASHLLVKHIKSRNPSSWKEK
eukprot:Pgem_evm1s5753